MSVEENIRIVREFVEAGNQKDLDRSLGYISDSFLFEAPGREEAIQDKGELRSFVEDFWTAFPDATLEEKRAFGEGEWVCQERIHTGTHEGPLQTPDGEEIPPTQNTFESPECAVFKVEDGEITEFYLYFDQATQMEQLGLSQ